MIFRSNLNNFVPVQWKRGFLFPLISKLRTKKKRFPARQKSPNKCKHFTPKIGRSKNLSSLPRQNLWSGIQILDHLNSIAIKAFIEKIQTNFICSIINWKLIKFWKMSCQKWLLWFFLNNFFILDFERTLVWMETEYSVVIPRDTVKWKGIVRGDQGHQTRSHAERH